MQQSSRESLRAYRVYLIDSMGHIAKAHEVEAASDEEACELASVMLSEQSNYPVVEVWDRARQVRRIP